MSVTRRFFAVAALAAASVPTFAAEYLVYIGTYTRGTSKGIHAYRLDDNTGKLTSLGLAAEMRDPSFVAIHPNGRNLYAVGEGNEPGKGGAVAAFTIDKASGKLTPINQQFSKGGGPCHIVIDKTGKSALVANYGGGSVISFPVKPDGSLGEEASFHQHQGSSANPKRQAGPHTHSVNVSPDNRFAAVADLGLDQVLVYKLDPATAKLTPNDPPFTKVAPGGGPRHFAFHPSGKWAYVINEILLTVTAFNYEPKKGTLTEVQTISTLPAGVQAQPSFSTAEVQVHPSGRFLYGSNRGHDTIAVFTIDQKTGKLTHVDNTSTQGRTPRNFGIAPSGKWLIAANQSTNNMAVYSIDQKTGKLTPTGQIEEVGAPVCVKFLALK
jgi:6-phosphogluconolactonase